MIKIASVFHQLHEHPRWLDTVLLLRRAHERGLELQGLILISFIAILELVNCETAVLVQFRDLRRKVKTLVPERALIAKVIGPDVAVWDQGLVGVVVWDRKSTCFTNDCLLEPPAFPVNEAINIKLLRLEARHGNFFLDVTPFDRCVVGVL